MERPPTDRSWLTTACGNCGQDDAHHLFGVCHPWATGLLMAVLLVGLAWSLTLAFLTIAGRL